MKDWTEMPEASGPQSEGVLLNPLTGQPADYGQAGYPSLGQPPRQMSVEQMNRERDADDRRYQVRLAAERAAIAAGQSALEAASTADRMLKEAAETARKVSAS